MKDFEDYDGFGEENSAIGMASGKFGHGKAIGKILTYLNEYIDYSGLYGLETGTDTSIRLKGQFINTPEQPDINITYVTEDTQEAKVIIEINHGKRVEKDIQKCKDIINRSGGKDIEAFVYDFEKNIWIRIKKDQGSIKVEETAICTFLNLDLSNFNNKLKRLKMIISLSFRNEETKEFIRSIPILKHLF